MQTYPSNELAIAELLMSFFDDAELRRFLKYGPQGDALARELPSPPVSLIDLAHAGVAILSRRGLIDGNLFDRLLAERPGRKKDIERVHLLVRVEASQHGESGASLQQVPPYTRSERDLLDDLENAALQINFTAESLVPEWGAVMRFEKDFYNPLWTTPRVRGAFRFRQAHVSFDYQPELQVALARVSKREFGREALERVRTLQRFLEGGTLDTLNYTLLDAAGYVPNIAVTTFSWAGHSMLVSSLLQIGALPKSALYDVALDDPLYWPGVQKFYNERLIQVEIYSRKDRSYVRVAIPAESEMGEFFSTGNMTSTFSEWYSPGWCSRYLLPQMIMRSYLSSGSVITDFSEYLIGAA